MNTEDAIQDFARLANRPEEEMELSEAALFIARAEYPALDVQAQLRRLDVLASQAACDPLGPAISNIQALNELLFDREGFRGNEEDYDDPRNSYLNDVLERKKGIPISLSVVYISLGRRRSLPVFGVGFPGHFLVKYVTGPGEILIDPFRRGAIVSREDCERQLKAQFGAGAVLKPEHLAIATNRQILGRMLNNLKASYYRRKAYAKVLNMIQLSLALDPWSPTDLRDRGMIYLAMRRYREAMADFSSYLRLAPPDDPQTEEVLKALQQVHALMN
jgi:regulator of sirC expression with transglutaminase-like and TPR domain